MCNYQNIFYYSIPFLPIITRLVIIFRHCNTMKEHLGEPELDKESHRANILILAGFSFSGLLAVTIVDSALRQSFSFAVYYLLISFLCYLLSSNMQSYKSKRWHDQLVTAITETASLSLILSILSILHSQAFDANFAVSLSVFAFSVWLVDHIIRLTLQEKYLKLKEEQSK